MAIDGIYHITFRGAADWGMGLLILKSGIVTGADIAGVTYDGKFTIESEAMKLAVAMTVPPGVALVQGIPAKTQETKVIFSSVVPLARLDDQQPVLIPMEIGPVNVIFKKLRAC